MKKRLIACTLIAAALAAQSTAFADDHGRGHGHGKSQRHYDRHDRHDRDNRHDQRDHRYYHNGRGAGPHHDFYRGQRLSAEYRRHEYVVDNWRYHRLSAPPRGYHWVQTGSDYVLIAITTGIIAQIVLSN